MIKRHLRYQFGEKIFIAEHYIVLECSYNSVPMFYGEYKHYKDGDRSQKPEKCSFWSHDMSIVVKKRTRTTVRLHRF
jgi:hypothetical protein